ncbi:MAG: TetR/AcrR family transcriptional regulator [Acholeplasmatales bacterium]|nr:TetR/AcrR family transcriptional regulator [Acholeplasmatales bacterium]
MEKSQQTKDKILDCTIEMLKAGDVDTISMSKIASNANIGKSTIYEYFPSKEELIKQALKRVVDIALEDFLSVKMGKTLYESYYAHMKKGLEIAEDAIKLVGYPATNNISFMNKEDINEMVSGALLPVFERLVEIYNQGVEEKTITQKRDFSSKLYILAAFFKGMLLEKYKHNIPDDEFMDDLYENLLVLVNN